MICPYCGTTLRDGADHCPICQHDLRYLNKVYDISAIRSYGSISLLSFLIFNFFDSYVIFNGYKIGFTGLIIFLFGNVIFLYSIYVLLRFYKEDEKNFSSELLSSKILLVILIILNAFSLLLTIKEFQSLDVLIFYYPVLFIFYFLIIFLSYGVRKVFKIVNVSGGRLFFILFVIGGFISQNFQLITQSATTRAVLNLINSGKTSGLSITGIGNLDATAYHYEFYLSISGLFLLCISSLIIILKMRDIPSHSDVFQ
ncbi:zinc ribbon domain-containing protein [Caldiplasma sukawensis]